MANIDLSKLYTTNYSNNYYVFVKKGVIFDIKKDGNEIIDDECAINVTVENAPSFTIKEKTQNETTYYLVDSIEKGDIYENGEFKKSQHSDKGDEEISFQEYFKNCVDKKIEAEILDNKTLDYHGFIVNLQNKKPFPYCLLEDYYTIGDGDSINGIDVIQFTSEKYDEYKENGIITEIKDSAKNIANGYGLNVTIDKITLS